MIEQKLEKIVMNKIDGILSAGQFGSYSVYGSLQPGVLKQNETDDDMIVVVKVSPRSYQTPTTPICQIDCSVTATIRADVDYNGNTYLDVCDKLMTQYEKWQKCMDDAHNDFTVTNQFDLAGFQLTNGSNAIDGDKVLWQYTQSFTLFGVVR